MGIFGKKDSGIFETLKQEHREVSSLLTQIQEAGVENIEKARDLFAIVEENLLAHAKGEEKIVYPRFAQLEGLSSLILEAREEHEIVENLLMKLDGDELDDEAWMAACKVLQEQIEHHVKEEEGEIFPVAKDQLDTEESERLAKKYLSAKAQLAETILTEQLESLTKNELLERAQELGIPSRTSMTKAELIAALSTRH